MDAKKIAEKLRAMDTYDERIDYLWGSEVKAMLDRGDISEREFEALDSLVDFLHGCE